MKKINIVARLVIITLMSFIFLNGCEETTQHSNFNSQKIKKEDPKPRTRIKVIDNGPSFTNVQIIEVDGHQYLYAIEGGLVHLESCPCKNR